MRSASFGYPFSKSKNEYTPWWLGSTPVYSDGQALPVHGGNVDWSDAEAPRSRSESKFGRSNVSRYFRDNASNPRTTVCVEHRLILVRLPVVLDRTAGYDCQTLPVAA